MAGEIAYAVASANFAFTDPVTTPTAGRPFASVERNAKDLYFGGRGVITGTVKEKHTPTNTPVYRRVRLIRDRDGLFIRETWSDPVTGAYSFPDIDAAETYTALSYDHTGNFRAVAADKLIPTVA